MIIPLIQASLTVSEEIILNILLHFKFDFNLFFIL